MLDYEVGAILYNITEQFVLITLEVIEFTESAATNLQNNFHSCQPCLFDVW